MKVKLVFYSDILRWDPVSIYDIHWNWDKKYFRSISSFLEEYRSKINLKEISYEDLQFITIHFNGSIDARKANNKQYSMKLYEVHKNDIVLSKIDLKNGAVGICPNFTNKKVAITSHFASYHIDTSIIIPEFFLQLIQCKPLKEYLWRNKVGAEGRKEVKLDFFENIKIPVPTIETQQIIINYWEKQRNTSNRKANEASVVESKIENYFYYTLGLIKPDPIYKKGPFLVKFSELYRWDYHFNSIFKISHQNAKYKWITLREVCLLSQYGVTSKAISKNTGIRMLRITDIDYYGKFDINLLPFINITKKDSENYQLKEGDLIVSRTGATAGKSTHIISDYPDIVFASYLIRFRFMKNILPEFVEMYLNQGPGKRIVFEKSYSFGQPNINAEIIKEIEIPLPPLTKQKEIVKVVNDMRKSYHDLIKQSKDTISKSQIKLNKMLLGEIDV